MSRHLKGEGFEIIAPDDIVDVTVTIPSTPTEEHQLDQVIRAFVEGDGETLHERRADIETWLRELRRYRETVACIVCKRTVLGRQPVCLDCFDASLRQLIAESLTEFTGTNHVSNPDKRTVERARDRLRKILERKIGR